VRKVAAKATYQIGLLLEKHPAMKGVVLSEIERLIHRTNVSPKAQVSIHFNLRLTWNQKVI